MGGPEGRSTQAGEPAGRSGSGGPEPEAYLRAQRPRGARRLGVPTRRAAWGGRGRGNKPRGDGFAGLRPSQVMRPRSRKRRGGKAATATTMPPVHPARGIRQGQCGHATAPSDRPSSARMATRPASPPALRIMTGRRFGSGAKGDGGQRDVDRHPPLGHELRRAPADRRRAVRPGARRLCDRRRHLPHGERRAHPDRRDRRAGDAGGTGQMQGRNCPRSGRDRACPGAARRPDRHDPAGRAQL